MPHQQQGAGFDQLYEDTMWPMEHCDFYRKDWNTRQ